MILDMAHAISNACSYTAGGVGLVSAVVAQSTQASDPPIASGAIALGTASIIAAAGPHVFAAIKLFFDDRRDARSTVALDLTNQLKWNNARLAQLEKIASGAEALRAKAREVEIRYEQSQAELDELREVITKLIQPVAENQEDLKRIATGWKHPGPPPLKAETNPATVPEPPALRGSGSGIHPVIPRTPDPESVFDAPPGEGKC